MEFKILRETKGVVIAEFLMEKDRDDCFDFLKRTYEDCEFVRANGDDLEELD